MAQIERYGIIVNPTGHRLILEAGTHAFTSNAVDVTLTVKMRKLVAGHCRPGQAPANGSKSAGLGGVYPYVSTTMFTGITAGRVVVSRLTAGGSLGAKFSYTLIGY
jgi:hypothetical protein